MTVDTDSKASELEKNAQDYLDLKQAVRLLESPSLTAKITDLLGSPVEWAVKKLPAGAQAKIHSAVEAALHKSVSAAL